MGLSMVEYYSGEVEVTSSDMRLCSGYIRMRWNEESISTSTVEALRSH